MMILVRTERPPSFRGLIFTLLRLRILDCWFRFIVLDPESALIHRRPSVLLAASAPLLTFSMLTSHFIRDADVPFGRFFGKVGRAPLRLAAFMAFVGIR